jgi:hypothetical protein
MRRRLFIGFGVVSEIWSNGMPFWIHFVVIKNEVIGSPWLICFELELEGKDYGGENGMSSCY